MNQRSPKHGWHYTDYLLSDKLFSGHCGKPMIGESGYGKLGVRHNYYKCSTRKKDHNACRKRPIRQDQIEPLILEKVKGLIEVFINAIYVYDDNVKIVFIFKGGTKIITLTEVNDIGSTLSDHADRVRNLSAKV